MPKAPNNYHPVRQHDAAVARRNWVIGRMHEDGYITAEEAEQAKAEPLEVRRRDETDYVTADYFAEEVRRQLSSRFGEQQLYEGGYSVRTTVDPKLQEVATRSLRDGLIAYDRRHGWRGPVANWKASTTGRSNSPIRLSRPAAKSGSLPPCWRFPADHAEIGVADGRRGAFPLAEVKWARKWLEGERLGPEVKQIGDVLAKGDVITGRAGDQGRQGQGASGRHFRPAPDPGGPRRSGRDGPPYRPRARDERRLQFQDQRLQPGDAGAAATGFLVQALRLYGGTGQRLHAFDAGDGCALRDPARSGTAAVEAAELLRGLPWPDDVASSAWKSPGTS